jgi:aminopeptidase N
VPMEFYVLQEHQSKAEHHLDLLVRSAQVLEKYFGEYPWVKEKIGIAETPHLGMEHQTMNAYGNKFNYTKIGGEDFDWLLHHEFGHEWWANKVTNRDWADMWIQEGFCAYGDALYTRELEGEEAYRKRMMRTGISAQNKVPIVQGESGIDAGQAYHGDIYGKASFFLHTLRFYMGDSIFFPTLKKFATDSSICCYNTATTTMVDEYFSAACGQKLTPLFDLYLRSVNKLEISVKQLSPDEYLIKTTNLSMPLPIEVQTDKGIAKAMIDAKGWKIKSAVGPVIDPQMFYLKKVSFE